MRANANRLRAALTATTALTGAIFLAGAGAASAEVATPAAAGGADVTSVQEVVITAQKRSESLINVPISVTAVSGDGLARSGVASVGDLSTVVPGLHIDSSGAFFQPSIRGVGTAIAGAGASANVATYVDGIYKPNALSNDFDFIDVESVQVLKGPQGTLFGRNSTGGAIVVTTRAPSSTPEFEARVGYGSFNTATLGVFASTGLTDNLSASVSVGGKHSDGWTTNIATGRDGNPSDSWNGKLKLLYRASDKMKFTLTLDGFRVNDPSLYAATSYKGWSDAAFFGVTPSVGNSRQIALTGPVAHTVEGGSVALKSEFDLGWATLTSYTAGQWESGHEATNEMAAPFPQNGVLPSSPAVQVILTDASWLYHENTYTQEFDLSQSGKGPIDWVAGAFIFYDDTTYSPFNLGLYGPLGAGGLLTGAAFPWPASAYVATGDQKFSAFTLPTYSGALFADATYNMGNWHLTLGARSSWDRVGERFTSYPMVANGFTAAYLTGTHNFTAFTPRAILRYSLSPNSNVYVSYSEGTKAGLFNSSGFLSQQTPLQPEKIKDIEAGYKIATRTWRFETSAFHYDYTDLQVATYIGGTSILQNAKSAELYGIDMHYQAKLTDQIEFDLGAAYTHGRYTDFKAAAVQTFSPIFGVQNGVADVSNGKMTRTPEFTATAALTYKTELMGGTLELTGNGNYQTESSFDFANTLRQSGYTLVNLRAAWTDPSRKWTASLNGRNILDKKYLVQILPNGGGFGATYGEPVNVMAQIQYKY